MQVAQMLTQGQHLAVGPAAPGALPPAFRMLARYAALASRQQAFDPMEKAFNALAAELGETRPAAAPLREYSLAPGLRAMTLVWPAAADQGATHEGNPECVVAAKGAPEAIAQLCRLAPEDRAAMLAAVDGLGREGLRVLAVAAASAAPADLPASQEGFAFRYLGLLALADPIRPEIPAAIRLCRAAGIRVLMITGDYPATASSIALQAGLEPGQVLSGDELDQLDDLELAARLHATSVCARIAPAQKLRIVQALKRNGDVVAMTGDGVNDAPALKAAHVGIAMGGRGTDVAREAGALVLLDDNFASIVRGIRLGRRIFGNMRNAMAYVLAMHVPIAGLAILPAIFGWPLLLYPMQIAFLELIIDPACSLAFENEGSEAEAMRLPPRDQATPLLDRGKIAAAVAQGALALLVVAGYYAWALGRLDPDAARSGAFVVLVLANLMLIFSNLVGYRSVWHGLHSLNRIPLLVALLALASLAVTLYVDAVAGAFHFAPLAPAQLGLAALVGSASLAGYEAIKRWTQPRARWAPA
jgi:Ca2+-transporting ATPase